MAGDGWAKQAFLASELGDVSIEAMPPRSNRPWVFKHASAAGAGYGRTSPPPKPRAELHDLESGDGGPVRIVQAKDPPEGMLRFGSVGMGSRLGATQGSCPDELLGRRGAICR